MPTLTLTLTPHTGRCPKVHVRPLEGPGLHQLGDDDPRPHTQPSEVDGGLEYRFEIHPFSRARRAAEKVSSLLAVPVEIDGGRVEVDAWRR